MSCLDKWVARTQELAADRRSAVASYRDARKQAVETEDAVTDAEEAQRVAQIVAQAVQEQAHARIASVVSKCLEAVFDEPYEFKILFEQKRGRTEARLVFVRDDLEVDPLTASGGGVVDVAAFALRLACLLLSKPALRKVVILDEPFRFVSAEYRQRVRTMVESLAKDMEVQFIMVTHMNELKMGTTVEL